MLRLSKAERDRIRDARRITTSKEAAEMRDIASCASSEQVLKLAKMYEKAFQELFLEYEEKCPEEGCVEDEIINDKLDSLQTLVLKAKWRYKSLCREGL
jgi:aryl carrier-like protein